jgi:hypothetical protein
VQALHFTACSAIKENTCQESKQQRRSALQVAAQPLVVPPLAVLQRVERRPLAALLQVQALRAQPVLVPPVRRAPWVRLVRPAQVRACLVQAQPVARWQALARLLPMPRLPHTALAWRGKESAQGCSRQKVPRRRVR